MAFALNTIQYAWETNPVAQSGSVLYTTPTKRIWIAETGSRTFLSVDAEMYVRDANNGSTFSNITAYAFTASVDGNSAGDPATSATITMTGDHATLFFKQTFTNLFNARFTGSNHDVSLSWQLPQTLSGPWIGHSFRLICTYQYDDDNVGRNTKTVALPLDAYYGSVGTLLTSHAPFGSTTPGYTNIPALTTFLPETNKTIRDYWIEYTGVDACNAAADVNMFTQIDSGSEVTRFVLQGNLNSDTYYFDIQSGSFDTSSAHTLNARASLTGRLTTISPTLYVTYEYDTTSSMTMNSCIIPFNYDFYKQSNIISPVTYFSGTILIPERDPSLVHSALIMVHPVSGLSNRTYTVNGVNLLNLGYVRGSVQGSPNVFNIRFDSDARTSANISLNSGFNEIRGGIVGASAGIAGTYSGYYLLNYSASALSSPRRHNRTIYFGSGSVLGFSGGGTQLLSNFVTGSISDEITSSYYSNGYLSVSQLNCSSEVSSIAFIYNYTGSQNISASLIETDNFSGRGTEQGYAGSPYRQSLFKYYDAEPVGSENPKLDYFRRLSYYRWMSSATLRPLWRSDYFTMNQNKIGVTGSLLNCNFTSSTYTLNVYLSGSNVPIEPIAIVDSSGSGTSKKFYFDWYESANKVYAVSTNPEYGISNFATASQGDVLTIDFGTPDAGGEHSYTWIG